MFNDKDILCLADSKLTYIFGDVKESMSIQIVQSWRKNKVWGIHTSNMLQSCSNQNIVILT